MKEAFSGCEIVELAVQIEKNGKDFYSALEKKATTQKAARVFGYLADAEARHIRSFKKINARSCRYEPAEAYPDEYFSYMNALAGQYIFTRKNTGEEAAKKVKTVKEGIELGIAFEKDSILFYETLKAAVQGKAKSIVDCIIAEERKHLVELCKLKGGSDD